MQTLKPMQSKSKEAYETEGGFSKGLKLILSKK